MSASGHRPTGHLEQHLAQLLDSALEPRWQPPVGHTAPDWLAWQHALRTELQKLLRIEGRLPSPGVYDATRMHEIEGDGYREEKYLLSLPEGVQLPCYLLTPSGTASPPFKPILLFHGHDRSVESVLGRYISDQEEQDNLARQNNYAQRLAQRGFLVCVVEQRGFGERVTDQVDQREFPRSCRHLAFSYLMMGRTVLGEKILDGMHALNFLLQAQSAVLVPGRVGCTGHSGGGTTALWLSALDPRISVSVPAGYFCSFRASVLAMPHCECNYVPSLLQVADMGALAALVAPRPLCLLNGARDEIYPLAGARDQFPLVQHAYAALGAADAVTLAVHPDGHAYHHDLSWAWFAQHL